MGEKVESKVEVRGIDYIPESERNSKPSNAFFVLGGAQLCFSVMIIGALPILFGLGWWDSFSALTIGLLIGSFLIAPLGLLGQKTGTNGPVSSGAHFGTKGRVIGALLTIFASFGFYTLTVLTGAQSLVYSGHRLFGWPEGNGILVIGALIISLITSVVAVYGHSLVIAIEKVGSWIIGTVLILSIIVFLPQFDASYQGGDYLLGGYWPTWLLAVSTAISIPVSCSPFINDYTRYIPGKTRARSIMWGCGGGMLLGCWISMNTAAYLTSTFTNLETPFVQGIIEQSPAWFVPGFILVGLIGSLLQGSFALYGAGLGLETLGLGLNRIITTVIISVTGTLLVCLIIFVYDLTDIINAFVTIIIAAISPWLTINLVGYYLLGGHYSPLQLHESKGGLYWYSNGFNLPAVASWVVAVVTGLLFTNTSVFVGPLVNLVGGVDISFVSSAIVGAALFFLLVKKSTSKGNEMNRTEQSIEETI
ncbi:nitrate reductase [Peribacillus cavernae]|uniref:Nitrate reductase n=1 Tax=Peribacillus cavernae TaxID=1674310 RepID=A0A3S0U4Y6_9BACI|nr:cytosine permease [Peribacillus cavernae]MDQ0217399.1 purine-cytosine permease-like protein [Peribacillus cavernae]RUQ30152.1 nitrate reductase [Peribacillus cavernae]